MAFITQRGETWEQSPRVQKRIASTVERQRETSELEALVSGVNSVSQATLLLKKMKESREVDDALDYMKEQFSRRMAVRNYGRLERGVSPCARGLLRTGAFSSAGSGVSGRSPDVAARDDLLPGVQREAARLRGQAGGDAAAGGQV